MSSIPIHGDSPSSSQNGVTTGLPPIGDDHNMTQILQRLKNLEEKNENWETKHVKLEEENIAFHNEMKILKKAIGPKAQYVEIGGDVLYYSNLKKLLPRLRAKFADDDEGLKQLEIWAKRSNKKGNLRVGITMGGGVISGAAVGGAVALAHHVGIALGSVAIGAGIAAAPVVFIVIAGVVIGVIFASAAWSAYKLYQKNKLSEMYESKDEDDATKDGDMAKAQEYTFRDADGAIVENVNVLEE